MGLTLAQIFDMVKSVKITLNYRNCLFCCYFKEEKTQILVTNVWLDIEWGMKNAKIKNPIMQSYYYHFIDDEFLKWNPDEFNGLKIFRISTKKIW